MRSEKEIRKQLQAQAGLTGETKGMTPDQINVMLEVVQTVHNNALKWVLEGEPRYSVADLEKIIEKADELEGKYTEAWEILIFLKDKKKVEAVL